MKDLRLARQGKRPSRAKPAENVLREGLRLERVPDPSIVVLFGATGDLAHRKVIPAIYQLWRTNLLPHEFVLLAIGRRPYDDESFRADIRKALEDHSRVLPLDEAAWTSFAERIVYHHLDFHDPEGFEDLAARLATLDAERGTRGNYLFYLAIQPSQFAGIIAGLGRVGLDHERHDGGWRRVVIEKPFGHDLESAKRLNREVGRVFRESQVYRIDHYLGKETVRNLHGLPVRERHLRAALESALRRPRPDHRGRIDRHREPRRRSTSRPAPRATSSRTTCSSS